MPATQTKDRQNFNFDHHPGTCPICNHAQVPIPEAVTHTHGEREGQKILEWSYWCTNTRCGHQFVARFKQKTDPSGRIHGDYFLYELLPLTVISPQFEEEISGLSPDFVKIYQQAHVAEKHNLDEICGVGYRKALEFLIKDYCISLLPHKKDSIQKATLGACIENYVDVQNIKDCAKMAVWLGNDQTHYVRKWEEKDIEDLKILIRLTINWITYNFLTNKYRQDMAPQT
ncbi:MAG: hypothetical protein ABIK12_05735 [Pseudomonadota bacterium]